MRVNFRLAVAAIGFILLTNCGSSNSSSDNDSCGTIGLDDKSLINDKIIDGTACDPTSSPVVEVLINFADGSGGLCSGTMLDSTHVLTAGHCFENPVSAVEADNGIQGSVASGFVVHPQFATDPTTGVLTNDVAIVTLANPLTLPSLPILRSREAASGDQIEIYGYGKDENGNIQVLKGGFMQVTDVSENSILAIFTGSESDTCNGDSGGPAVDVNSNGAYGVAGTTSTGTSATCSTGDQSLFMNMFDDTIFNFIVEQVPDVSTI